MSSPNLRIEANAEAAADDCSRYILASLRDTLKAQPRATLAISGGSSPRLLFSRMAAAKFDWSNVHFFWVDERCVAPTDKESNYKLANDTLLTPAAIKAENVHRLLGELPPEQGAARYVQEIRNFFQVGEGKLPIFDLVHRGMGPDAHTASLFPGSPLVHDRQGIATSVWVEKFKSHRVTLLPGVLLAAKNTVLQATGDEKADAVHHVLREPEDFLQYPCQIASRDANATWFLDKGAASKL